MATIKDVALDAGVAVGTVSKVINGQYVSEKNRKKVEESIERLGYQMNFYARGLKVRNTYTVAAIVPETINPFFPFGYIMWNRLCIRTDIRCFCAIHRERPKKSSLISVWLHKIRWTELSV